MAEPNALPRYRSNLQGEVDGAAIYAALAESEADPKLAEVFRRLAAVEEAHGDFWRKRIEANGAHFRPSPSARTHVLAWLARRFGPAFVLPTLAANETRDSVAYDDQPEARGAGLPADERSHALLMRAAAGKRGISGPTLALLEGRHRGGGNTLRAAVLGANDGLVSNMSLVMGVAGAAAAQRTLLLTGLAGLVAGACSMAMGEGCRSPARGNSIRARSQPRRRNCARCPTRSARNWSSSTRPKASMNRRPAPWRTSC